MQRLGFGHFEFRECYFRRQPQTEAEIEQACQAVQVSCVGGPRYGGNDPKILARLREPAVGHPYAAPPPFETYPARRFKPMSLGWLVFAVLCLGFAALPAVIIADSGQWPPPLVVLFLVGWSALPLTLAAYLGFWGMCRVELLAAPGWAGRRATLLGFRRTFTRPIDRVYLARVWYHSKHGSTPRDVLLIRSRGRKHWLADELTCATLEEALRWLAATARVKAVDLRHRKPLAAGGTDKP